MTNRFISRIATAVFTMSAGSTAVAHPGHDHSHWSSPALHALLAVAVLGVAGVIVYSLKNRKQKIERKSQEGR